MKLKSKLLLALLATSAASFANAEEAADPLAFNVGVVSQYRYRGIAQTKGDAALQGGADYTAANGFYAGAWGSTIKWIKDSGAPNGTQVKGPVELDLYGGYKFEASGVAYDVGFLRYEYVGNTLKDTGTYGNANTNEVYGAATYGVATLKYSNSLSDLFGNLNSKHSTYWDLSATYDLGQGYSLVPHVGRQTVKNSTVSYTDYALTLNKDLGEGLSASVSAIALKGLDKTQFNSVLTNYNVAKNTLVVGVKYTF